MKKYNIPEVDNDIQLYEPIAEYCRATRSQFAMPSLFKNNTIETDEKDIRVVELFAGVGGFRVGLERASGKYKTVWSNQWEPSTKRQDASIIYVNRFGMEGHSNEDINTVLTENIPECDMLVGGFPCQDYSVATTLKKSGGIEGKKGVLWWQIYRIIDEMPVKPKVLFFENVDRLLKSPASQRGRDFAIMLASLSDLGYDVEWRVINAADYGMPQRRRRTYIIGYRKDSFFTGSAKSISDWILKDGIFARAFPVSVENLRAREFEIKGALDEVSAKFNKDKQVNEFENAGFMHSRKVTTLKTSPDYDGPYLTLGDILLPDDKVDESFYISPEDLPKWEYQKSGKTLIRTNAEGFQYKYSEGGMAFPDYLDRASRTIITGEGGSGPSRFKHVVLTKSGRFRRLTPIELERLNMFPDNHTEGASDLRRAFLMGNALVTGIIEKIGYVILNDMKFFSDNKR